MLNLDSQPRLIRPLTSFSGPAPLACPSVRTLRVWPLILSARSLLCQLEISLSLDHPRCQQFYRSSEPNFVYFIFSLKIYVLRKSLAELLMGTSDRKVWPCWLSWVLWLFTHMIPSHQVISWHLLVLDKPTEKNLGSNFVRGRPVLCFWAHTLSLSSSDSHSPTDSACCTLVASTFWCPD